MQVETRIEAMSQMGNAASADGVVARAACDLHHAVGNTKGATHASGRHASSTSGVISLTTPPTS